MDFKVHLLVVLCIVCCQSSVIPSKSSSPSSSSAHYVSDACDWEGSKTTTTTLDTISDRSVMPIYLRCSRGNVKWFFPRGGLRVVLKLGTSGRDFRGCIRVARNSTRNARIYIEGRRQLHQIYAADDGKHEDLFRCFVSYNSFIALFIETEPNSAHPHDHVIFGYDLQAANKETFADDMDECKPCTNEQLLSLFCSADFAFTGMVTYFHDQPKVELSEFVAKPLHIYRFPFNNTYVNDLESNDIGEITLHRLLKCDPRANLRTKYLFLGRQVLGNYLITCAPKLSHWRAVSGLAVKTGKNQCQF